MESPLNTQPMHNPKSGGKENHMNRQAYRQIVNSLRETGEAEHGNLFFELDDFSQTVVIYSGGEELTTIDCEEEIKLFC